jgi:hypothetical protein
VCVCVCIHNKDKREERGITPTHTRRPRQHPLCAPPPPYRFLLAPPRRVRVRSLSAGAVRSLVTVVGDAYAICIGFSITALVFIFFFAVGFTARPTLSFVRPVCICVCVYMCICVSVRICVHMPFTHTRVYKFYVSTYTLSSTPPHTNSLSLSLSLLHTHTHTHTHIRGYQFPVTNLSRTLSKSVAQSVVAAWPAPSAPCAESESESEEDPSAFRTLLTYLHTYGVYVYVV